MKQLSWVFIIIILPLYTLSQENFVPGTIITTEGDTLHGFIDDQRWTRTPHFFDFKSTIEDTIIHFDNENASYVTFSNQLFVSQRVTIDLTTNKVGQLVTGKERNIIQKSVFLRTLIKGKVSLYYYKDENSKEHFYIQKDTSKYDELIYQVYKVRMEGTSAEPYVKYVKRTIETYKGQLIYYLSECPNINVKINEMSFNYHDITKMFGYYYNCISDLQYKYFEKPKTVIHPLIIVGMVYQTANMHGGSGLIAYGETNPSFKPIFGIGYLIEPIKKASNFKYYLEATYTKYSQVVVDKYFPENNTTINGRIIALNNTYGYYWPYNRETKLYSRFGASTSISKSNIYDANPVVISPIISAGIIFKKFSLDIRFLRSNIIKPKYYPNRIILNSLQVLAGYKF